MSKNAKKKKRHIPDSKQTKLRGRNQSHGGNDPMCFIAWGTFHHFHPPLPGMQKNEKIYIHHEEVYTFHLERKLIHQMMAANCYKSLRQKKHDHPLNSCKLSTGESNFSRLFDDFSQVKWWNELNKLRNPENLEMKLVGGWTNPFESQIGSFPQGIGVKNKKIFELPPLRKSFTSPLPLSTLKNLGNDGIARNPKWEMMECCKWKWCQPHQTIQKKVPKFSWKKVDPNFRTASAPQIFFLASNNVS